MTLAQYDRIEIQWVDASLGYNYEGPAETAGGLSSLCRIGYFIGRRKDPTSGLSYLVIASEHAGSEGIREPMSIPEQWIVNITRLTAGKTYAKGRSPRRTK